jgi:hypothetical protein
MDSIFISFFIESIPQVIRYSNFESMCLATKMLKKPFLWLNIEIQEYMKGSVLPSKGKNTGIG